MMHALTDKAFAVVKETPFRDSTAQIFEKGKKTTEKDNLNVNLVYRDWLP